MTFETNSNGGWIVPARTTLPASSVIPAYSEFGAGCKFGTFCMFGYSCKFGNCCEFGDCCEFSNCCELGSGCKLGNDCELGNDCVWLGVTVDYWLTMSNVDGSGRQIKVVKHGASFKIEAGCFIGSAEEFIAKAKAEGRHTYAAVIKAVVEVI